jgi:hypothetical protein
MEADERAIPEDGNRLFYRSLIGQQDSYYVPFQVIHNRYLN